MLTLLLLGALYVVGQVFEPQTLEPGRRQLRAMNADPIVRLRVPGTRLLHEQADPAARQPFGGGTSPTIIVQRFQLVGEPGDAVEAYRLAAEAGGWTFVGDGCSRVGGATGVVLNKRLGDFDATLVVHAEPDQNPSSGPLDSGDGTRRLEVRLEAAKLALDTLPVDAGLHHSDVHCLRNLNLSDPNLRPPHPPSVSLGQLCSRLPLGAVQAIVPEVTGVLVREAAEECWLVEASDYPLFMLKHVRLPRAYYEDRRLPTQNESDHSFLFSVWGKTAPELERAVWVAAPEGPLVVRAGGRLSRTAHDVEGVLFAVARLLSTRGS